jgi:hypothetical protein
LSTSLGIVWRFSTFRTRPHPNPSPKERGKAGVFKVVFNVHANPKPPTNPSSDNFLFEIGTLFYYFENLLFCIFAKNKNKKAWNGS